MGLRETSLLNTLSTGIGVSRVKLFKVRKIDETSHKSHRRD